MAEFVFIDWSGLASMGAAALQHSLKQDGIKNVIVVFPKRLSDKIKNIPFEPNKKATRTFREALKYLMSIPAVRRAPFIGISFFDWYGQTKWEAKICRALKAAFPKKVIIAGGPAFETNPKGFFSVARPDYAIRGEGEKALPILIKILSGKSRERIENVPGAIFRRRGRIIIMPRARISQEELQKSPLIVATAKQSLVFAITSRGCAKACIFCSVPRKGNPVAIPNKNVIEGLMTLAKNPKVREVEFMDDQMFSDRKRSIDLLQKIIANGLNKRFRFGSLATIDSLILEGKPESKLIKLIAGANFKRLEIGTEALADGMLREIKSGRYTAIEAMRVTKALVDAGVEIHHFMLAGSINTTPAEFLETFYRSLAKEARRLRKVESYGDLVMILAWKGTPIYERALRENALYDLRGNPAGRIGERKIGIRVVVPKNPLLKELFLKNLRKGKSIFDGEDLEKVAGLGEKLGKSDPKAAEITRRLKIEIGRINAMMAEFRKKSLSIGTRLVSKRLAEEGRHYTNEEIKRFVKDIPALRAVRDESEKLAIIHERAQKRINLLRGTNRLRAIQELRRQTGTGVIINPLPVQRKRRK